MLISGLGFDMLINWYSSNGGVGDLVEHMLLFTSFVYGVNKWVLVTIANRATRDPDVLSQTLDSDDDLYVIGFPVTGEHEEMGCTGT